MLRSEERAVLDTNVLISAFLFPTSTPRRALDFALDHGKLLISLPLLRELYGVLQYPKFDQYASPVQRMQFVNLLTEWGPESPCFQAGDAWPWPSPPGEHARFVLYSSHA